MDVQLNITRRDAAEKLVEAHIDQLQNGGQIKIYILDGDIDYTRYPRSPHQAIDLYDIWEWTLGDVPADDELDDLDWLVEAALDKNGLDLVPEFVYTPDGSEVTIFYTEEE